jgi:predicted nucleic acid-binding protein
VYLLDTNVVSEMRRLRPNRAVVAWLDEISADQIFIAAITLGELQAGVEMTRQQEPLKAEQIEAWINDIADSYAILPMDGPIFRRWAQLMHRRSRDLLEDALIAATALINNLTVATRNLRDFERLGVTAIDPFQHR